MWKTIPCLYELMIFTWVNVEQFALHLWIFIYLKIYEFKDIKLIILVFTGSTIHLDCYKLKSLELIRVAKNKWRWRNLISWHMVGIHHTRTFLTKEVYNCFTPFPMWKTSYEIEPYLHTIFRFMMHKGAQTNVILCKMLCMCTIYIYKYGNSF